MVLLDSYFALESRTGTLQDCHGRFEGSIAHMSQAKGLISHGDVVHGGIQNGIASLLGT